MSSPSPLRRLIVQTATALGPDAPTLCTPWTVRDLVAHLVVRERRPDALPGIGVPLAPLERHTAGVQQQVADQDFAALVEQFGSGPAPWWPTQVPALDRLANTSEHAVHHEDMVRAQPGWEPTDLGEEVQAALWGNLRAVGKLLYRTAPTGVVAIAEGHGRVALRRPPGGSGTVVLRGTPLELVLHATGRVDASRAVLEGSDEEILPLQRHRRSL